MNAAPAASARLAASQCYHARPCCLLVRPALPTLAYPHPAGTTLLSTADLAGFGDLPGSLLGSLRQISGSSAGGSFNATDWIPELLDRIHSDAPSGGARTWDNSGSLTEGPASSNGGGGLKRDRSQVPAGWC